MDQTHHHLGRAIMLCLARTRLTGMAAAESIGISQSGLVRIISGARRADPATLCAISRAEVWRAHPHAGQQIMIGHLMDELERAGWRSRDILMRARGGRQYALRALHEIEEHIAAGDEAVAELVTHVADILRRASLADSEQPGAEPRAEAEPGANPQKRETEPRNCGNSEKAQAEKTQKIGAKLAISRK
jgi:hypothetical protein